MKVPVNVNEKIKNKTYSIELLKENVYHIEEENDNSSSMYCIVGNKKALWIDLGNSYPERIEELKTVVKSIVGEKEVIVMITHNHFDHIGQLEAFKDSKILFPKKDIKDNINFDDRFEFIEDGYTLDLGNRVLKMIEVAGHTIGSMAVLDEENEIIATGDAIGSSYVWLFFVDDVLNVYKKGVQHLYENIKDYKSPLFLCGHRAQQFASESRDPLSPINENMNMQYVKDMIKLIEMIENKTALTRPYFAHSQNGEDCVYYFEGSSCEIDSFVSIME